MRNWTNWLLAGAIAILTLVTFAPVRTFGFVNYDDGEFVVGNPHVTSGLRMDGVRWAFSHAYDAAGGPLTWLSHMADVERAGLDAGAHHATSLWLHVWSAVLLFLVLAAATRAPGRSAVVAALFAVHPLHVESVAWVAARKDVLSMVFWLLAIGAYLRYVARPSPRRYAVVLLLFAAGLLSKPVVVTLPIVLLLLDYWPLRRGAREGPAHRARRLILEKIPLAVMSAGCLAFAFASQQRIGAVMDAASLPVRARVPNALVSCWIYLEKTIWPARLEPFYPYRLDISPLAAGAAAAALIATTAAVMFARRTPALAVGWGWYLVTLVPVAGLVQVGGHGMADRATYLPLIGVFIAASWGGAALLDRAGARPVVSGAAAALIVLAYAIAAHGQTMHWHDSVALWRHAVSVDARNARAHANLGVALAEAGDRHAAAGEYETALALNAGDPRSHNNLALILAGDGRADEAIAHYREALRLDSSYASARVNLANLLDEAGRSQDAIAEYERILAADPDNVLARANLAIACGKSGEVERGLREMQAVIARDPANAQWRYIAAMMWMQKENPAAAIPLLKEALRLDPTHAEAEQVLRAINGRR